MWAIIKFNKKNLSLLKHDITKKLGNEVKFYIPKINLENLKKNKIYSKESFLLGDYLLCFHNNFSNKYILESLKYCKGLKYFLTDFFHSQKEIKDFIEKCKQHEDEKGYIKQSFFEFNNKKEYQFISGPFSGFIFKIINENKTNLKLLMGNLSATVSKEDYLFRPA